jgi:hypothetical protein
VTPDLPPTPGSTPDPTPEALEEAKAWEAVVASWQDEAAHRAYLARWPDLDGLTRAGKRYRAVLAVRPADPVAQRWRDEIVKRATVQGLAQLPRTAARAPLPRWVKYAIVSASSSLLGWLVWRAFELFGRPPVP